MRATRVLNRVAVVCLSGVKLLVGEVGRDKSRMMPIIGHVETAKRYTLAIVPGRVVTQRFQVSIIAGALDVV